MHLVKVVRKEAVNLKDSGKGCVSGYRCLDVQKEKKTCWNQTIMPKLYIYIYEIFPLSCFELSVYKLFQCLLITSMNIC